MDDSQGIRSGSINTTRMVPLIPSVDDVAVARPDAVPEVPVSVATADPIAVSEPKVAKRQPVDFQYHRLNWDFIKLMAQIANYADGKYGSAGHYTNSRLVGEKSPVNHIIEHVRQYLTHEPHDHFGRDHSFHLAAIAYNAMMEFYYYKHGGGPTTDSSAILYGIRNPFPRKEERMYMERANDDTKK